MAKHLQHDEDALHEGERYVVMHLYSYGLHSYCLNSYGLCSYGLHIVVACVGTAYIVMAFYNHGLYSYGLM